MLGKYAKKRAIRAGKAVVKRILKSTAPLWVPVLIILLLAYSAFIILFELPREALADSQLGQLAKTQSFLGLTITDYAEEGSLVDAELLTRYKKIANSWDNGLTDEQKKQVQRYKFPYTILMAVDRVVNDEAIWDSKQNVQPQPQKVFDSLKPIFYWRESIITTVTVSVDGKGGVSTSTSEEKVQLLTMAETFEGTYIPVYEWDTTTSGDATVTREVLKDTTPPDTYYIPLKDYLREKRGIKDEDTFELVQQLAIAYSPEEYLQIYDTVMDMGDLQEYPPGNANIPYYSQADKRWGSVSYGKVGTIYSSGCGPTSLAMVVSGLTGRAITPDIMASWSVRNGYRIEGNGSAWALMTAGGERWGLKVQPISRVDGASIAQALSEGRPIVASMGKGSFTNGGHFIVLRGITEAGKVLVHDPISVTRSEQEWDLSLILRESSTNGGVQGSPFWAFSR